LWREYGLTLILVTHDSTVAARAQRIGHGLRVRAHMLGGMAGV
jgi:predicted ABC-type transport system involved in lysophospholipase L1 biosynthesis ATPase subunit